VRPFLKHRHTILELGSSESPWKESRVKMTHELHRGPRAPATPGNARARSPAVAPALAEGRVPRRSDSRRVTGARPGSRSSADRRGLEPPRELNPKGVAQTTGTAPERGTAPVARVARDRVVASSMTRISSLRSCRPVRRRAASTPTPRGRPQGLLPPTVAQRRCRSSPK
jgi:hypothetical protein